MVWVVTKPLKHTHQIFYDCVNFYSRRHEMWAKPLDAFKANTSQETRAQGRDHHRFIQAFVRRFGNHTRERRNEDINNHKALKARHLFESTLLSFKFLSLIKFTESKDFKDQNKIYYTFFLFIWMNKYSDRKFLIIIFWNNFLSFQHLQLIIAQLMLLSQNSTARSSQSSRINSTIQDD